jgi:hypothetical protein
MPKPDKTVNPPVWLARYSNEDFPNQPEQGVPGAPRFNEVLRNWDSLNLMARNGSFWARGDAGNFGIRSIATKMVQKGLKRTLIA